MLIDNYEVLDMLTTGPGLVISSVVSVVCYVLFSIGLYTMAKNRGIAHAWFGWIPILQLYLVGELTGDRMWGFLGSKWILALGPVVVGFVTSFLPPLGGILGVVYGIYTIMVVYKLYQIYSNHPLLFTILSILFSTVGQAIIVFAIRNNRANSYTI